MPSVIELLEAQGSLVQVQGNLVEAQGKLVQVVQGKLVEATNKIRSLETRIQGVFPGQRGTKTPVCDKLP